MTTRVERKVREVAAGVLDADESVLAVVRADVPRGRAMLGAHFGAAGAVADAVLSGDLDKARARAARQRGDEHGFDLAENMVMALTERRLLAWSYEGLLLPSPRRLLGHFDLARVEKVEYSRSAGTLGLWLPGRTLELAVPVGHDDAGRTFAMLARERIAALG